MPLGNPRAPQARSEFREGSLGLLRGLQDHPLPLSGWTAPAAVGGHRGLVIPAAGTTFHSRAILLPGGWPVPKRRLRLRVVRSRCPARLDAQAQTLCIPSRWTHRTWPRSPRLPPTGRSSPESVSWPRVRPGRGAVLGPSQGPDSPQHSGGGGPRDPARPWATPGSVGLLPGNPVHAGAPTEQAVGRGQSRAGSLGRPPATQSHFVPEGHRLAEGVGLVLVAFVPL